MDNRVIPPPGEMVTAGGGRYHVRTYGEASERLIVCETGLMMMTSCWGWLAPALAKTFRVICYDRAGLGWSEEREGPRDGEQIAGELRELLAVVAPGKPFVLLGHSIGAIYNRALLKIEPQRVQSIIWLDPAHPDQMQNPELRQRMRGVFFYLEAAHLLASNDRPRLTLPLMRAAGGLPQSDAPGLRYFLNDARHLKTSAREARRWADSAAQVRDLRLPEIPLLIISGGKHALPGWKELQRSLAELRPDSKHLEIAEASHFDLILQKAVAERVAEEIEKFLGPENQAVRPNRFSKSR